jgi:hypothetical protein
MFTKVGLLLLTVFVWTLSISTCRTARPTSDATPPIAKWSIQHIPRNTREEIVGDGSITQQPDETLTIMFIAIDPEGLHVISLGGGGSYTCIRGDQQAFNAIDQTTDRQTLNPDSNGQVLTRYLLIRNANLNAWACDTGLTFNSGSLTLVGTAENFFGGRTTATLTINRTR